VFIVMFRSVLGFTSELYDPSRVILVSIFVEKSFHLFYIESVIKIDLFKRWTFDFRHYERSSNN